MTEPLNRLDAAIGRMALEKLLVTPKQLEAAIEEQLLDASAGRPRPLGTVLVARGILTDRQLLMLLEEQAKEPAADLEPQQKEDLRLGAILVRRGEAPPDRVQECLRLQAEAIEAGVAPVPRLGELLVRHAGVPAESVRRTLAVQQKTVLACGGCGKRFNAKAHDPSRKYRCPSCGGVLAEAGGDDVSVDRTATTLQPVTGTRLIPTGGSPIVSAAGAGPDVTQPPPSFPPFGKYTLVRELGRGAMGVVYEAVDVELRRKVALKMMRATGGNNAQEEAQDEERFLREARLGANLPRHPNIVATYEAGVIDGRRYLASELIIGQSMSAWRKTGSVNLRQQVQLLRDVALALHHAHENGILHRDMKPENVLVDVRNRPFVTDFGLAKTMGTNVSVSLTAAGMVVGTPSFMSPEQAQGLRDIDRRTDVYSLGVMLFEILAGRPPFTGNTAIEVMMKTVKDPVPTPSSVLGAVDHPGIDSAVENICLKALAKKPEERYGTAKLFAEDLTKWLRGEEVRVVLPKKPRKIFQPKKSHEGLYIGAGIFVLALLGILFWPAPPAVDPGEADRRAQLDRLAKEERDRLRSDKEKNDRELAALKAVNQALTAESESAKARLAAAEAAAADARRKAEEMAKAEGAATLQAEKDRFAAERAALEAKVREADVAVAAARRDAESGPAAAPAAVSKGPAKPAPALAGKAPAPAPSKPAPAADSRALVLQAIAGGRDRLPGAKITFTHPGVGEAEFTVKEVNDRGLVLEAKVAGGLVEVPQEFAALPVPALLKLFEIAAPEATDEMKAAAKGLVEAAEAERRAAEEERKAEAEKRAAAARAAKGADRPGAAAPPSSLPGFTALGKNAQGALEFKSLKDGAVVVLVPAGEFIMGTDDGDKDERPARKVWLDGYLLDKTEVTWTQYKKFAAETNRTLPRFPWGGVRDDHPALALKWDDAAAYAAWAGRRLPTEAEWEKGARGTDGRKYPWGADAWDAGGVYRANLEGNDRADRRKDGFEYTAPVGSFPAGASPYGLLDMAGNVQEWCADWYDERAYAAGPARNPTGPSSGKERVLRGSSLTHKPESARCSRRDQDPPGEAEIIYGVRCAFTPPDDRGRRPASPAPAPRDAKGAAVPPGLRPEGKNAQGFAQFRNLKDDSLMVLIPAGEFIMGSTDADPEGEKEEKPQRRVHLDAYLLDRTETTWAQYRKFCTATGHKLPDDPPGGVRDDNPVERISWTDAAAYCEWSGKRLPTEAEWEKGARGTDGRLYPWGAGAWDAGGVYRANTGGERQEQGDRGGGRNWDRASPERGKDGFAQAAPVGSYPAGASPYGLLDMAGNVWEWCADWYDPEAYQKTGTRNPLVTAEGKARILRGCCWYNRIAYTRCAQRGIAGPQLDWPGFGFRGAMDAPAEKTPVRLAAAPAFLSDLTPVSVALPDRYKLGVNRRFIGAPDEPSLPLLIGGQKFKTGLGVHATSELVYDLDGHWRRFEARVGVDQNGGRPGEGTVVFQVFVDDEKKFESPVQHSGDPPLPVSVDVAGGRRLKLVAAETDDGANYDHADWAEARLSPR